MEICGVFCSSCANIFHATAQTRFGGSIEFTVKNGLQRHKSQEEHFLPRHFKMAVLNE